MIRLRYCDCCQAYRWIEGGPDDRKVMPVMERKFQCGACARGLKKSEIRQYILDNGLRRRKQRLHRNEAGKWVRPKTKKVTNLDLLAKF